MVHSIYYIKELSYRVLFHVLFLVLILFWRLRVMQKALLFPVFFSFFFFFLPAAAFGRTGKTF